METVVSTSQETEIMIDSCKNNCLFYLTFSLFRPSSGCLGKSLSCPSPAVIQKHMSSSLCIFSVSLLPLITLSTSFLVPSSAWCPPKATKDPWARISVWMCVRVCVCVCVCVCPVHQTRSALVLYFIFPESFIERTFPAVSAESRLDVLSLQDMCVCVCVCVFVNTSIVSIIYEMYQASFLLYFQETPRVKQISLGLHSFGVLFSIMSEVSR